MRLLTRYIFREIVPPSLIGFGFYTFIILMRNMFDLAELIIRESLPTRAVAELLALSIPHIVVLTLPMSLLVGILIAIGRLSADSEITAMRSAGIAASSIYRPVFIVTLLGFGFTLWMINVVMPRTNALQERRKAELISAAASTNIKPRVFFDSFENYMIYVDDVNPDGSWKGVFIADRSQSRDGSGDELITVARSGQLSYVPTARQLWLELNESVTHSSSPSDPEGYDLISSAVQRLLLVDQSGRSGSEIATKTYRSMTLAELREQYSRSSHPIDRGSVSVEIHKKFAIPFACIAFGVVALPLGITNRRGGRSGGFSVSLAIILVYYVLLNSGEDLARDGKIGGWVIWVPNLLLLVFGAWLIRRANQEAGASTGLMDRITSWASTLGRRERVPASGRRGQRSSQASRGAGQLDLPFPTIVDRYVMWQFLRVVFLVLLSTLVLFIVVDYAERAGDISRSGVDLPVVLDYYRWYVLQALNWMIPISVLLATLITFGMFSRNNELTAIKSSGMSLYRLSIGVMAMAAVAAAASYLLMDHVLPHSNEKVAELKARIKGREAPPVGFGADQRQWLFGQGRHLFNFLSFDRSNLSLQRVQVFEFHPAEFRLVRRVAAERAQWDGQGWVFENGWIRSFGDDGEASYTPIRNPVRLHYPENPKFFAAEAKTAEQMNFAELRRYISELRSSGYASEGLEVKLYEKTSWPFISIVMALIALAFSFRMGRRGAMHGIGIAMILAFSYWVLFGFFTKFGETGSLPPLLAAWSANILFAIAAIWLFLRVET